MRILVEGDSWAYVWSVGEQLTSREGFPSLLRNQGHEVVCTAQGGSSNSQSLDRVRRQAQGYDVVIWTQTEPVRDWFVWEGNNHPTLALDSLLDRVRKMRSLDTVFRQQLAEQYRQLDRLGPRVLLIGGCSRVQEDLLAGLSRVQAAIPSVTELLLDYPDCLYQNTDNWLDSYAHSVRSDPELSDDWAAVTDRTNLKLRQWFQDRRYFSPDDWHPNWQGHRRIFEVLQNYL